MNMLYIREVLHRRNKILAAAPEYACTQACPTCDSYVCPLHACPHSCPHACPHVWQNPSHVCACPLDLYLCHLCLCVCPLQHLEAQLSCPCEHGLGWWRGWVCPCWLCLWSQVCLACIGHNNNYNNKNNKDLKIITTTAIAIIVIMITATPTIVIITILIVIITIVIIKPLSSSW